MLRHKCLYLSCYWEETNKNATQIIMAIMQQYKVLIEE